MNVEHKLSPTVATYARRAVEQMNEARKDYLAFMGQAKEAELRAEMIRSALAQQLAIVQAAEGLPTPLGQGYQLSADGTKLIGEIADPEPEPEASANGAKHV